MENNFCLNVIISKRTKNLLQKFPWQNIAIVDYGKCPFGFFSISAIIIQCCYHSCFHLFFAGLRQTESIYCCKPSTRRLIHLCATAIFGEHTSFDEKGENKMWHTNFKDFVKTRLPFFCVLVFHHYGRNLLKLNVSFSLDINVMKP